jgi:hypothetical protein
LHYAILLVGGSPEKLNCFSENKQEVFPTKQSKAKQSKAKQSKAKQSKAKQSKAKQNGRSSSKATRD